MLHVLHRRRSCRSAIHSRGWGNFLLSFSPFVPCHIPVDVTTKSTGAPLFLWCIVVLYCKRQDQMAHITDRGVYESAVNVPRSLVLFMSFFMSWSCLVQSNHGQLKEGWDSTEASGTSTWMSLYRRRQMTARPIETRTGLLWSLPSRSRVPIRFHRCLCLCQCVGERHTWCMRIFNILRGGQSVGGTSRAKVVCACVRMCILDSFFV